MTGRTDRAQASLGSAARCPPDPVATHVEVTDDRLTVHLADERAVSVPLSWFPRLAHASPHELANWQLLGDGEAIEWPDLDEHIGVDGLLAGRKSGEGEASVRRWRAARVSGKPGIQYRRSSQRGTWHWFPSCPWFPAEQAAAEILFVRPATGEYCNTCRAKERSAAGV